MLRVAIAFAVGLTTIPADAQIFKCTPLSGSVEYRDGPCPAETATTVLPIDRAKVSDESGPTNRSNAETSDAAPPVRTQKRRDVVAINSFPGPRSIPPALPVAALPPPPPK